MPFRRFVPQVGTRSQAIFGEETTDDYGAPLDEHFRGGVHYQDHSRVVRVSFGQCDTLTVGHVDGYIVFTINKSRPFSSAEQLERNGAWQGGEIVQINVFYFDSREVVELFFHADGSPRRFQRCEFADAPTNLPVPFRPGKEAKTEAQQNKALVDDLKTILPTLVLYSTAWNRDGSVAKRVDEPTDVAETLNVPGDRPTRLKMSEWIKRTEEAVAKEAAAEKPE